MAAKALIPEDTLYCSLCCDIFKEPVVLKCSHSFCKVCLKQYWEERSSRECPVCRRKASVEEPPVSLALKNIEESYLQQKTERETPEKNEGRCSLHGEKLVFFCERDKELLCLICQTSKKHRNHPLCPVEEAAQDLKKELKPSLNLIKDKLKRFPGVKLEYTKTAEHIRSQAQSTERQIKGEFDKLHRFQREEEEARLAVLKEEERTKSQIMEEKIENITRDVSILTDTITATEKSLETEDTSFIKSYKSIRDRAQCSLQDPELLSGALIDVAKHLGNLKFRVWEKMLEMVQYNPSAPGRVEATDVRSSSVTLCWERPVSMEGVPHEIHITYSCEGEEPRLQKCAPNTTSAVLSDLRPGMEYTFNISTVPPNGSCSKTRSVCVRTQPFPPGRVKVTDVKSNSVRICWERPFSMERVPHEIHITYSCEGEEPRLQKCAPNTTTAVLSDLRPGMEYTFNITTLLPYGSCSKTSSECVCTNPSAPGRVEATDVKSSSVTLCWERPVSMEGVPHEIHISYSCEGEEPRLQKCDPNTTTAVLSDLRPVMEYTFNSTTVLPNGSCSDTSSVCVRTQPSAPGRVEATDVKSSSVTLCWERPVSMEGVPHEIHITYSCEGEEPRLQKCAPNTTTAVLSDLRPGIEYTFNITTVLPNGSCSETSKITICTPPGKVEATDVKSSSVTLCWERPVSMEGVPHEIHITYSCEGEEPRLQKCAPNTTTAVLSDLRPVMEYTFNITTVPPNGSCSKTRSVCVRTLTGYSQDELSDLGLEQHLKNNLEIREEMFRLESIKKNHFAVVEQNVLKLIEKCRKSKDLTDEQLEAEFERMWADTVVQLKLSDLEKRDVVLDIDHQLRSNLGREGGSVQEMLSKVRNLCECGTEPFEVKSKERSMFTKAWHTIFGDEHRVKTQKMADHIIKLSRQFVDEKVRTRSDYCCTYMAELLHTIDKNLEQDRDLELTTEFKAELKIHICGHAAREFQKMHLEFICANDPRRCLEQFKEQCCADFKDLFHERDQCQKKAEDFTYNCLTPAVRGYITRSLGPDLVDEVLTGKKCIEFTQTFIQFSVLKQLLEDDHFQDFVNYINNYQSFVQEWIFEQMVQQFAEGDGLMIYEIKRLKVIVHRIKTAVKEAQMQVRAEEDQNIQQFIQDICSDLQKELIIPTDPLRAVLTLNTAKPGDFSECLIKLVDEMEQHLTAEFQRGGDVRSRLTSLPFKPQKELFNRVFGCGKQCPLCRIPCEAGGQNHTEHFASLHRPQGMWGVRNLHSSKLEINICTSRVASEENFKVTETGHTWQPYKDFKSIYPDWQIQPDTSIEASDYWKYIFSRFNQQFAEEYKAEPADIPLSWTLLTKDQVMESLRESF